jgi:aminoglycoside phosphotransferase (APT) family kinase protein
VADVHREDELRAMAELAMGAPVVDFGEHDSAFGSSRKAYVADTTAGRAFLRCAVRGLGLESTMFTLRREAAILGRLAGAGWCVPRPLYVSDDGAVLVLEWLDGEVGPLGDRATRERLARTYAETILSLPDVDAEAAFADEHASAPTIAAAVEVELQRWREIATPSFLADPVGGGLLHWLEDNRARDTSPSVVVHGDAGHGNFMVVDDRITGFIDWEMSHLGDPVEDLACMQMRSLNRDAAAWSDALRSLYRHRGVTPDRARVGWERAHVLVRSAIAMRRSREQGNEGRSHAPFARYESENLFLSLVEVAKLAADHVAAPPDDLGGLLREALRRCSANGAPSSRLVDAGFAFAYAEVDRDARTGCRSSGRWYGRRRDVDRDVVVPALCPRGQGLGLSLCGRATGGRCGRRRRHRVG